MKIKKLLLSLLLLCLFASACGVKDSEPIAAGEVVPETKKATTAKVAPQIKKEDVPQDMRIHFLDVGQGLSVLAESQGRYLIYDGGGQGSSSYVVAYLREQGVEKLDYVIASHYDADHLAGLVGCLNVFSAERVLAPDYEHDTKLYSSFMKEITERGIPFSSPVQGETFTLGAATFNVLSAKPENGDSNDYSLVIKIMNGQNSCILTGDASAASEAEMIRSGRELSCDILSIGHHGSASSTSWDFLEKTVPEVAVISVGRDNSYGHPDRDVLEKLESMEIDLYRSDLQGTVIATSNGSEFTWSESPCNDYQGGDSGTQPEETSVSPDSVSPEVSSSMQVWKSASGKKYHTIPNCGTMNPDQAVQMSEEEAQNSGLGACSKCCR